MIPITFFSLHWMFSNEMTRVKWGQAYAKTHGHWIGKYIYAKYNLMCKYVFFKTRFSVTQAGLRISYLHSTASLLILYVIHNYIHFMPPIPLQRLLPGPTTFSPMQLKVIWIPWVSCLHFPMVVLIGIHHRALILQRERWDKDIVMKQTIKVGVRFEIICCSGEVWASEKQSGEG